jgi:hypothetical protein
MAKAATAARIIRFMFPPCDAPHGLTVRTARGIGYYLDKMAGPE